MIQSRVRSVLLASVTAVGLSIIPAEAQWAVFDAQNYAQNVLEATRALREIDNQVQQIQNQALMLQNMGRNLSSLSASQLGTMISGLAQISTLMNQASGIAFNVNATNSAFASRFPQTYPAETSTETLEADARLRWQEAMAAFQRTLTVQAQVAQNVQSDSQTLSALVTASQSAEGNLQVSQATNQLLALSTKQQLQIQSLMAAQYRAAALDDARNAEAEEEARSQFSNFIGSGTAYNDQ